MNTLDFLRSKEHHLWPEKKKKSFLVQKKPTVMKNENLTLSCHCY